MQPIEGAVVAAAGLGSRLGLGLPKCLLEIEGRALLSRLIDLLEPHVPRIHVVVGYREELVIEHCSRHHREVVLVRNADFRTTNTARSMAMGARAFSGKIVFLDGDLLIARPSVDSFIARASTTELLVGLTKQKSEDGVCVRVANDALDENPTILGFARDPSYSLEWANIFAGPACILDAAQGFVFEELGRRLPLPGHVLDLSEVDTPSDLDHARQFGRHLFL